MMTKRINKDYWDQLNDDLNNELNNILGTLKKDKEQKVIIHRGISGEFNIIVIEMPGVTKGCVDMDIETSTNTSVINIKASYDYAFMMAKKDIKLPIYVNGKIDIKSVSAEIKDGLLNIAYKYASTDKEKIEIK